MKLHGALASVALALALGPSDAHSQPEIVFVGSGKKNIESFRFDAKTGALTKIGLVAELAHPSFLSIAPNHKFLYAITEGQDLATSTINAYAIDAAAGKLTFLNQQPAGGSVTCDVEFDRAGKDALIANYGTRSFAVFPLAANGKLQPVSSFVQDQGTSTDPVRQTGPHAHCLLVAPGGKFAFGCDLGVDKVMSFKFDADQGTLVANEPAFAPVKTGSGPRHMAFHPNGRWAYVICEMGSLITAFGYDSSAGALHEIQTISTLPDGFSGRSTCAEVAVHPNGKVVYGSNRGDDSIAVFGCDPATGRLTFLQRMPTGGRMPRNFEIDLTSRWLLVANQESNTVVVFGIDSATGQLRPTGIQVPSDAPECVRFLMAP